jgi:hypothetical protein
MLPRRWLALLVLGGCLSACGVRGNPRPPLPDVRPPAPADAGPDAGPSAAPDAGR